MKPALAASAWVVVALVLLAVATHHRARAAAPRVPFDCSFATSWQACGFTMQAKAPDRIAQVEVAGVAAVRLQTLPGDAGIAGSGGAERADLSLSPQATGCSEGAEQWWAHSVLFPQDYALPVATAADPWPWGVVFDFHQTGSRGQANFQIDVADNPPQLRFSISGGPVVSDGAPGSPTQRWPIGPVLLNHWYQFIYHVKWSSGSDGRFDAWVDGRQRLSYSGPTLYAGQSCYLKLANYHTPVGKAVAVVHGPLVRCPGPEMMIRRGDATPPGLSAMPARAGSPELCIRTPAPADHQRLS